jgi:hypothetical protein
MELSGQDLWALWPDTFMCPFHEADACIREGRSDDFEVVNVIEYDESGEPYLWVPKGFLVDPYKPAENCVHIHLTHQGGVTIDWKHRCFALGWGVPRVEVRTIPKEYAGPGWRIRLLRDAVAALQQVVSSEAKEASIFGDAK